MHGCKNEPPTFSLVSQPLCCINYIVRSVIHYSKGDSQQHQEVPTIIIGYVKLGWPSTVEEQVRSYYLHKDELTVEQGCLLRECKSLFHQRRGRESYFYYYMKLIGGDCLRLMKTWKVLLKHAGVSTPPQGRP